MEIERIEAEVEIDFADGKRNISMLLKQKGEIKDCEEGNVVILNLRNGETHTGIFNGMDGDNDIMLRGLSGKTMLGYKIWWLSDYYEEIK